MTSVKVETKSDFLHQEQKCIDFFWTTTGHVYFSDTVGHTSLLCYMYVACQCNDHNYSVRLLCRISFDQKKKLIQDKQRLERNRLYLFKRTESNCILYQGFRIITFLVDITDIVDIMDLRHACIVLQFLRKLSTQKRVTKNKQHNKQGKKKRV